MNKHPIQTFIALIDFDRGIHALQADIEKLQQEITELKEQELLAKHELKQAQDSVRKLRKDVDAQELEIKELDQQEKEKKKRLDDVSNYKVYQLLQNEIATLKQAQHEKEEILVELWNKLEAGQRNLEKYQATFEEKAQSLRAFIEEKEQKIITLRSDLDKLNADRPAKEKKVPEEWLERYSAMRARVSDPVVDIVQGSCGACFYTLSNQDMLRLKRGALLQCKGCYRFLYIPEAIERSAQS